MTSPAGACRLTSPAGPTPGRSGSDVSVIRSPNAERGAVELPCVGDDVVQRRSLGLPAEPGTRLVHGRETDHRIARPARRQRHRDRPAGDLAYRVDDLFV